ncbi:MAG: HsdR family type I site-specific deoxyribonuclease, partial [Algicola sp.]|nr:HsdR family type I site-specific deoxyribonuclease [Algicola sp.]
MAPIGDRERSTQDNVIQFFEHKLEYDYLGDWKDRGGNSNIEPLLLRQFLARQGYAESLIVKTINALQALTGLSGRSLYEANKEFYGKLRYGVNLRKDIGEHKEMVYPIDWENPLNNHFAIAEEVTMEGKRRKRPDIVIYINGIALGVLELKRAKVSMSEGIRQNLLNQEELAISQFFVTQQLVMAGNESQGIRYGTIETKEKYFLEWKEDSTRPELLFKHLAQLCNKERLLELIHDFVVFDRGVKKLARHNQYFGVKAAQKRVRDREGGIFWHTQGSGKSLSMVWLAKWIHENEEDSRVLIITDRTELDDQIEKVFVGVDEKIYRTSSGSDLLQKLNTHNEWLMCSLVHKFGGTSDRVNYDEFINELQLNLPKDFEAKGNLFVFVDECHRTQSGVLHKAMKAILPNAMFIGFTGTPLLKTDKEMSLQVFGPYIHTYKFDEAVEDKVILDLKYEARDVEQYLSSPQKVDEWFEERTRGLKERAKNKLKARWGTMQAVLSSRDRLQRIVADIIMDFNRKTRLMDGTGNALLVAGNIYQACKYYEMFQSNGFTRCAIITSYEPSIQEIKDESTGEGKTEKRHQYDIYEKMLNGKSVDDFEREVKKTFINEPGQMQLLIVVDKLLTGFDAPSATYLYIDKRMRDHGLFQAICRVNRLDGESKEYGYIIDYKDLFMSLENAISDYTAGAFEEYDKEDVHKLLENRLQHGRQRLEDCLENLRALCEPVPVPKDREDYYRFFCGESSMPKTVKASEPY